MRWAVAPARKAQDLAIGVGDVAVLGEGGDIGQHVRGEFDGFAGDLINDDEQVERLEGGAGLVLVGMQEHRVVAGDDQGAEAASAGRFEHFADAEPAVAGADREVAEADAVGLGREHVEAGGRGVDAGQDDGEVGGGADLGAGLRGVAARGGDDDGDPSVLLHDGG